MFDLGMFKFFYEFIDGVIFFFLVRSNRYYISGFSVFRGIVEMRSVVLFWVVFDGVCF